MENTGSLMNKKDDTGIAWQGMSEELTAGCEKVQRWAKEYMGNMSHTEITQEIQDIQAGRLRIDAASAGSDYGTESIKALERQIAVMTVLLEDTINKYMSAVEPSAELVEN